MKIHIDGSTTRTCMVVEGQHPELHTLPKPCTGNEAEYLAVIHALYYCLANKVKDVALYSDSQLVVNQLSGKWAIREPRLQELANKTWRLMKKVGSVSLQWIPREENEAGKVLG